MGGKSRCDALEACGREDGRRKHLELSWNGRQYDAAEETTGCQSESTDTFMQCNLVAPWTEKLLPELKRYQ